MVLVMSSFCDCTSLFFFSPFLGVILFVNISIPLSHDCYTKGELYVHVIENYG